MNFAEVYHRAWGEYCYAKNRNELIINIKTGYDVDQVWIVSGDPYQAGIMGGSEKWSGTKEEIFFKKDLQYQRWWTTTLSPSYKRLKYYFILKVGVETYYYFENGFLTEEQMNKGGRMLQYFVCPWMNESDISVIPDWVPQTVWYQIFPERFCNGDPSINLPGTREWECRPVSNKEFFGGDLKGIISKLDYLQTLGITGIYLTPVFESPSSHKYDTKNYHKIDPAFGDEKTLHRLVIEAHKRGIRVMLDMVFNHCGAQFTQWQDVVNYGPDSRYFDWFMINKWPFDAQNRDTRDQKYYSFAFYGNMPKLNTNNPEVMDFLCDVCKRWVGKYDVDGLRFDVGNEISHAFVRYLRSELKQIKPDLYLLGEIWHDASEWLDGNQYDGVMNYPLTESINDFWVDDSLTNRDFAHMVNRSYTMYREQNNQALFNLLDSHDTDRLFTRVREDISAFYQQLAVLFTMPGSPCIYYGTEIAMPGGHDPDCRRCMPWREIREGKYDSRVEIMKKLIHLRKNNKCFSSPYFHFPEWGGNPRVIVYEKLTGRGDKILVILNCSDKEEMIPKMNEIFSLKYAEGVLEPGGVLIGFGFGA